jgi:hypothetical protein
MKLLTIFLFIPFLFQLGTSDSPSYFDNKLNSIASRISSVIMKPNDCNNLSNELESLIDDIDEAKNNKDEYTKTEITELKKLLDDAEALHNFFTMVVRGENGTLDLSDLYLANKRVGATISTVSTGKFCVDVITISIGNHITYLLQNKTTSDYNLTYKYKLKNGLEIGSGRMTVVQKAARPIYHNTAKPLQKSIIVYGVICKENKHY